MNKNFIGVLVFTVCAATALFISGVRAEDKSSKSGIQAEYVAPGKSSPQKGAEDMSVETPGKFKIKAPDEHEVFVRGIASGVETVTYFMGMEMKTILVEKRSDGTRAYHSGKIDGTVEALIISDGNGFNLVSPDGKPLWKINVVPGLTKIIDAANGKNVFEIREKKSDKISITGPGGKELGKLKFHADTRKIKVKDVSENELYSCHSSTFMHAPAILLFTEIPETLRYVILSELIARER
ncbi:MAG: hypothetical protein HQM09_05890 [Candidatus Riflebacteria bacterium]|nr:hypothetical protein [Candidatus Riflebacteria bacterium]